MLLADLAEQLKLAKQVPIPVFNRRTNDAVPPLKYTRCAQPLSARLSQVLQSTYALHRLMQAGAMQGMSGMLQPMCAHDEVSQNQILFWQHHPYPSRSYYHSAARDVAQQAGYITAGCLFRLARCSIGGT